MMEQDERLRKNLRCATTIQPDEKPGARKGSWFDTAAVCLMPALIAVFSPSCASASSNPKTSGSIPGLSGWEKHMVFFGKIHCQTLANRKLPAVERWDTTYYDAEWVYYQIADYTKDPSWAKCAQHAEAVYRDEFVFPENGKVPGYWIFTHGLYEDFIRTGDARSKEAVILVSQNGAFATDETPLEWTASQELSREVAYVMMSYINAERLGSPRRQRLAQMLDQALGHIDQWFVKKTSRNWAPFMFGLTAEALIEYYEQIEKDPRIMPAIKLGLDALWQQALIPRKGTFFYRADKPTEGAPDLNLLIAPAYAWMYKQTGDATYRDRGDQLFKVGVREAYLDGAKQFNQSYRWSFDYLKWRQAAPLTGGNSSQGPSRIRPQ